MDTSEVFPIDIWIEIVKSLPRVYGVVSRLSRRHYGALRCDLEHYKLAACETIHDSDGIYHKLPNGWLHGERIIICNINQKIAMKVNYVNGCLHGKYLHYDLHGNMYQDTTYANGVRHGLCLCYYPSGKVRIKCNYVDGDNHGLWIHYYESGQIHTIYNYENGNLHGTNTEYNELGDVISITEYNHGKRTYIKFES
jgi:phenylpropionate dioxygenase-like ring-hydroxylating dioxygenase large terminal subunit